MKEFILTRDNIREAIELALNECTSEKEKVEHKAPSHLLLDLEVAMHALQFVQTEIKNGVLPPREKRSAEFIRYVIDEGPQILLKAELKEFITKIEDFYTRLL